MKKLTTALLAAAAISTAAFAEGNMASSGFYLGANAGLAANVIKYNYQNLNIPSASANNNLPVYNAANVGQNTQFNNKTAALFGVFAGYGVVVGQGAYFGGEVYGGFDTTKVSPFDDSASGSRVGYWKTTVQRSNFYGLAARVGYMVTPSTLAYLRLGIEGGKWKASVIPDAATVQALNNVNPTLPNLALDQQTVSKSKSGINFAPGIGMEAYITKNVFLRAEYSYLFGPSISFQQDVQAIGNTLLAGTAVQHNIKISQHQFKIGVGYKF